MRRALTIYLLSDLCSVLANATAAVLWPVLVLNATGSVTAMGIVAAAATLPAILAGILGGVIVDRFHRAAVSVASDLLSAASLAALPLLDALGASPDVAIFTILAVIGAFGDLPGMAAREALLPRIVDPATIQLDRAVATRESLQALAAIVGPAAAGGLLVLTSGTVTMWAPATLAVFAAGLTATLPRSLGRIEPSADPNTAFTSAIRSAGEGFRFIRGDGMIRALLVITAAAAMAIGTLYALMLPLHFTEIGRPGQLGLVLSAIAIGGLAGSALFAIAVERLARRTWYRLGMLGAGGSVALIAFLPDWWLILIAAAGVGVASGILNAVVGAAFIRRIPDALRGRVMGAQNTVLYAVALPSIVLFALVIDSAGLRPAALILGGLWLVVTAWALHVPALRTVGDPEDATC